MELHKLHVKIGEDVFNAEGKEATVNKQFEQFKELIRRRYTGTSSGGQEKEHGETFVAVPARLFRVDEKRRLVTLKEKPSGEDRENRATLLTLYGFKTKLALEEVPSRLLKDSLKQSGFSIDRLDRFVGSLEKQSLINHSGVAKGAKYWLTNPGEKAAMEALKVI